MPDHVYPTSAELAAMRMSLTSAPSVGLFSVQTPGGWITHPHPRGATGAEREHGIGAQDRDAIPCRTSHAGGIPCAVEAGNRWAYSLAQASALRAAEFDRHPGSRYGSWHPHSALTFANERRHGIPAWTE